MAWRLSPRAQRDVDDIWDYTCDRWGLDQADHYLSLVRDTVAKVAETPHVGRSCDDIRAGYRKITVGSHVIFYRPVGPAPVHTYGLG